jgi:cyclase
MLKKRIIPCLDVKSGRVVKGINFEGLIDAGDPVEQAQRYYEEGADEICMLDITATHENQNLKFDIIENIASKCFVPLLVGGGVKNISDIKKLLGSGADKISINSAAIKNPQIISEGANKFGAQCIILAIDAKKSPSGKYDVYIKGGRENTKIDAVQWAIDAEKLGAGELLLTSMDKDGTKTGYDIEMIKEISSKVNIPIIASGGVGNMEHLYDGAINGADALLAASIFHFKDHDIKSVKEYLHSKGLCMRLC